MYKRQALKNAGINLNKENKTDALFFMSRKQARKLAELISTDVQDKKAYKIALSECPSIDLSLIHILKEMNQSRIKRHSIWG